ncbi:MULTISPECIES: hypothetical protein [unclassified Variovorax]|uniref:hypothetical protein n=1 Tax=unclassified Variovorax TaxID=663243 RepID=UPI0025787095|nr:MULTISPECIES: hypothetical protein [unclassified Variovorax]MDM0086779.1 hypothetical protein [Variovorax sp. J22G40]MDM0144965.1 hypothetical protein [Variovorax sp. J2P1-31]
MIQKLIARFHAWREARQWEAQHIEWLRTMVHGDARWLANNPIAAAITERYEAAVAEDWYARDHEDVSRLRTRLGLDPRPNGTCCVQWPLLDKAARVDGGTFGKGVSSKLVIEAAQRFHDRTRSERQLTPDQRREAELARRQCWDLLNGYAPDAALEKACDLLSMTVGTLMSCRPKIGYVDNSVIAKLVAEVVEFLAPWPEKMPQADAAEPAARFAEVFAELERATAKFPTWPTDPLHAMGVLAEEFGELGKDVLQLVYEPHKTSRENVRKEATQTAAMALRFFASLDRYEYMQGAQHSQAEQRAHAPGARGELA